MKNREVRNLLLCLIIFLLIIILVKKLLPTRELFTDRNKSSEYPKNNENKYDVNSIDAYLIINLEKEKKRYASVINNLVDTGVKEDKIHRIDAVYERWNGHLGCGKSHVKALEYAINKNYKTVAILEDDFNFIEDKKRVNNSIDSFLSNFKEWDFIDLYYSHVTELKKTNIKGIDKNNGTTGAVGYIVKNNFYDKLLQNRKEAINKMQEYTDKHLIKCRDKNNCKRILEQSNIAIDQYHWNLQKNNLWYSFVPKLGKLMDTPSTIMSESFKNDIDHINVNNPSHNVTKQFSNNLIKYPVYWINLDRSKERRSYMESQFTKYNIDHVRINAIDGKKLDSYNFNLSNVKGSNSEIACTLSHVFAIKKMYDNNLEIGIVMEDDINLSLINKWDTTLPEIIKILPDNWEILQCHTNNVKRIKELLKNKDLYSKFRIDNWSTGFYIINKKGIKKIIDTFFINDKLKPLSIIRLVADETIYNTCVTYTYNRPLVYNSETLESTIHKDHSVLHNEASKFIINYYKKK